MTTKRILTLAYYQALTNWNHEAQLLNDKPGNKLTKAREEKAWAELEEIRLLLKAEEEKEA